MRSLLLIGLLIIAGSSFGGKPEKLIDKSESQCRSIGARIGEMLIVVKSNMAGSVEERKVFLKKLKPLHKEVGKRIKKLKKLAAKIEKGIDKMNKPEVEKYWRDGIDILPKISDSYLMAMDKLPTETDTEFLKNFTECIKYFAKVDDDIKTLSVLLSGTKKKLNAASSLPQ